MVEKEYQLLPIILGVNFLVGGRGEKRWWFITMNTVNHKDAKTLRHVHI